MGVRWDLLFADLVAQLDAADLPADAHALADLTRAEQATVHLTDRLRASLGRQVGLGLLDGSRLTGSVRDVGVDWLLVGEGVRQHAVPLQAITTLDGLSQHAVPAPAGTRAGRGLPTLLRALMRDRVVVQVHTLAGQAVGRVGRVGKDHVDVELVAGGARASQVVPFSALVCVSET